MSRFLVIALWIAPALPAAAQSTPPAKSKSEKSSTAAPAAAKPRAAPAPPPPAAKSGGSAPKHLPLPAGQKPHVDRTGTWVGHESGSNDPRYHLARPFAKGHYTGGTGADLHHKLNGVDPSRRRFWFDTSYFFIVAIPDYVYVSDWDWQNDDVTLYEDPDHEGWYLAYNERLGTYVHVRYDGTDASPAQPEDAEEQAP